MSDQVVLSEFEAPGEKERGAYKEILSDLQVAMPSFEAPERDEISFLMELLPAFIDSVSGNGGDPNLLSIKSTNSVKGVSGGYTAVKLENFTAFRLKLRGKQQYVLIPVIFYDLIPESLRDAVLGAKEKYIRLSVTEQYPTELYADFLVRIVGETVNRYPKEWDCCSRYMECSDAKKCVHPDKAFALCCGYRKILASGRIYYGKNRNVE